MKISQASSAAANVIEIFKGLTAGERLIDQLLEPPVDGLYRSLGAVSGGPGRVPLEPAVLDELGHVFRAKSTESVPEKQPLRLGRRRPVFRHSIQETRELYGLGPDVLD